MRDSWLLSRQYCLRCVLQQIYKIFYQPQRKTRYLIDTTFLCLHHNKVLFPPLSLTLPFCILFVSLKEKFDKPKLPFLLLPLILSTTFEGNVTKKSPFFLIVNQVKIRSFLSINKPLLCIYIYIPTIHITLVLHSFTLYIHFI